MHPLRLHIGLWGINVFLGHFKPLLQTAEIQQDVAVHGLNPYAPEAPDYGEFRLEDFNRSEEMQSLAQ